MVAFVVWGEEEVRVVMKRNGIYWNSTFKLMMHLATITLDNQPRRVINISSRIPHNTRVIARVFLFDIFNVEGGRSFSHGRY